MNNTIAVIEPNVGTRVPTVQARKNIGQCSSKSPGMKRANTRFLLREVIAVATRRAPGADAGKHCEEVRDAFRHGRSDVPIYSDTFSEHEECHLGFCCWD